MAATRLFYVHNAEVLDCLSVITELFQQKVTSTCTTMSVEGYYRHLEMELTRTCILRDRISEAALQPNVASPDGLDLHSSKRGTRHLKFYKGVNNPPSL